MFLDKIKNMFGGMFDALKRDQPETIIIQEPKPKPKLTEYQVLKNLIIKNGGNYKDGKPFLIGIRDDSEIDKFNDLIVMLYKHEGQEKLFVCKGTTDPGLHWTESPINGYSGAAIVCEGVYNDVWIRGVRKSFKKYCKGGIVLRQNGSRIKIRRDIDKDGVGDSDEPVSEGNYEVQFHCMGINDKEHKVGRWSAGCIGPMKISDYNYIMNVLEYYDAATGKKNRWSFWLTNKNNGNLPRGVIN